MLISFEDVSFGYDDENILENVSFTVNEGERIGLIGPNGEGKTTLIKLMCEALSPDAGKISRKNGIRIGWLEQNGGYDSSRTVLEEMNEVVKADTDAVGRLEELSASLSSCEEGSAEYAALSKRIESLHGYIAAHDSYNAGIRVRTVLNGMGFADMYGQVIDTMSGGEKTRLKICRLLLENPELLVLDEPTNHLDVKTLFWLEDWLKDFKGAIFLVSHDRYFLDRTVSKTMEIEDRGILTFRGNYSRYKALRAEYDAAREKEYEKKSAEAEKLRDYIARNQVRASTARSAQSRMKRLESLDVPERPHARPAPPRYRFTFENDPYESVLTIDGLDLEADGKRLITDGTLSVRRGDKLALVGDNGTGKSTLLKLIRGGGSTSVTVGHGVRFSVYDQENANLDPGKTVLEEMWGRNLLSSQTDVRASLARCGLGPDDVDKTVGTLSGGERAKLALCVFESERGNVLLLDEPTNHLDFPARESLEEALRTFPGTVIFVSHDRYFTSAIAGRVAEIEGGRLNVYECGYEEYREAKRRAAEAGAAPAAGRGEKKPPSPSFRTARERSDEARRRERLRAIETRMAELEALETELNGKLSDPAFTRDFAAVREACARLDETRSEMESLYDEYGTLI